jgi:hypothetical protein
LLITRNLGKVLGVLDGDLLLVDVLRLQDLLRHLLFPFNEIENTGATKGRDNKCLPDQRVSSGEGGDPSVAARTVADEVDDDMMTVGFLEAAAEGDQRARCGGGGLDLDLERSCFDPAAKCGGRGLGLGRRFRFELGLGAAAIESSGGGRVRWRQGLWRR